MFFLIERKIIVTKYARIPHSNRFRQLYIYEFLICDQLGQKV